MASITIVYFIAVECSSERGFLASLPDSRLSVSSFYGKGQRDGSKSRLNSSGIHENEGWRAGSNTVGEWIQADLRVAVYLYKVDTKGYNNGQFKHWIRTFQLKHGLIIDESSFEYVTSSTGGDIITFDANFDADTIVTNTFSPVAARYVRLYPLAWSRTITLLWELYGCKKR